MTTVSGKLISITPDNEGKLTIVWEDSDGKRWEAKGAYPVAHHTVTSDTDVGISETPVRFDVFNAKPEKS